ncbi:MAG TPA: TetR/AcrR family transcriptional regulator [Acidimicrobiales bacterium]|jgi:AcrR family transcriptional regulator|nr:TetR/AcrR family transcriptional regulator [Acidimicrobiales bacterium]
MATVDEQPSPANDRYFGNKTEDILAAAEAVWAERGYRATSMTDLAQAAGLSKPGLYHYVTSKEQLLVLLYQTVMEQHLVEERAVIDSSTSAAESLRRILAQRAAYSCRQQKLWRIFTEEEAEVPAELMGVIRQQRREREDFLVKVVEEGVAAGEFRLTATPRIAVRSMVGAVNFCYKWFDPTGPKDADQIGSEVAAFLVSALVPEKKARAPRGSAATGSTGGKTRRGGRPASD